MSGKGTLKCQLGVQKEDEPRVRQRVSTLYVTPVWSSSSGVLLYLVSLNLNNKLESPFWVNKKKNAHIYVENMGHGLSSFLGKCLLMPLL